jgi:hypothetical protein
MNEEKVQDTSWQKIISFLQNFSYSDGRRLHLMMDSKAGWCYITFRDMNRVLVHSGMYMIQVHELIDKNIKQ